MTEFLWVIAVLLVIVGAVGTVLPALPGVPLIFAGVLLAAWAEDFQRIGGWTLGVLAVLALIGLVVDYVAASMSAQRAGASRQGIIGAALGTVADVVPLLGENRAIVAHGLRAISRSARPGLRGKWRPGQVRTALTTSPWTSVRR